MKLTKIIALALCLIMACGVLAISVSADTAVADRHKLTGVELLAAYGITPYDGEADIDSAEIVEGKLVLDWGSSRSYPYLVFSNVPENLSKYTIKIEMATMLDNTNKANYICVGKCDAFKTVGYRTGEYKDGQSWANIIGTIGGLGSKADTPSFGTNNAGVDLTSLSNAFPATHTFEINVDASNTASVAIVVTIDNVKVHETAYATGEDVWTSKLGLSGWKDDNIMSYDNIVVTDDVTKNVVWSENFDDHSFGTNIVNVDENNHGYVCECGTADVSAHMWDAGTEIDDANSCQGQPSKKHSCLICGAEKTVVGKAHTPGEQKKVDATCNDDGYTETVCTVCNKVLEHTVIEKTGHSYGLWAITKQPTETEDGEKQQTCEKCGDVKTQVIEKTGGDEVTTTDATTTDAVTDAPVVTTTAATEEKGCAGFNAAAGLAVILSFAGGIIVFASKKRG